MSDELAVLRDMLCRSKTEFCRVCFTSAPHGVEQNPPNVFRVDRKVRPSFFFIFDKPNNNDMFRASDLVPITVFDARPAFGRQPSYDNLLRLLDLLGLRTRGQGDPLASGSVHVTNAVKCDKCALTGQAGRVTINPEQSENCVDRYLARELAILRPQALVFFGKAPQEYALGYATPTWQAIQATISGATYWMMRVPHTSPTSYNTHGRVGAGYVEPFKQLKTLAGIP